MQNKNNCKLNTLRLLTVSLTKPTPGNNIIMCNHCTSNLTNQKLKNTTMNTESAVLETKEVNGETYDKIELTSGEIAGMSDLCRGLGDHYYDAHRYLGDLLYAFRCVDCSGMDSDRLSSFNHSKYGLITLLSLIQSERESISDAGEKFKKHIDTFGL
jgi:hypothetical protein